MIAINPLHAIGGIAALALLAGSFAGGWKVRDWKANSDALEAQQAYDRGIQAMYEERIRALTEQQQVNDKVVVGYVEQVKKAESVARDLSGRLREHYARRCPAPVLVPPAPGSADGASGESGRPAEVDGAFESALGACQRDAARLTALQEWVNASR